MEIQEILDPFLVDTYLKNPSDPIFQSLTQPDPLLEEDLWAFGPCWEQVKNTYITIENLYNAIKDQNDRISEWKEFCRPETTPLPDDLIDPPHLTLISQGVSGSYFLLDNQGQPAFVIKPLDEDAGCLNNPKKYRSPFDMSPLRANMPLYRAPFREVAAYSIANMIGVGGMIPETVLTIIKSDTFYDFSESVSREQYEIYLEQIVNPDKEKLCSAQKFIPNSKSLFSALHELQAMELSDEEIAKRFDQGDFEEANILLWTTYDTDGHSGNFLCYSKGEDALGNEILGLKKIDSGLAFPEKNKQLRNHLTNLPNAKQPLSESARAKIASIDVDAIAEKLETFHLTSSVNAFRKRMAALKEFAQDPELSIQYINRKMAKL